MQSPVRLSAHHHDEPLATQLGVRVDTSLGRITLVGELDRQTAHQLLDATQTLTVAGLGHWVVDVRELHFCDAGGLRAIGVTYRRALRHGRHDERSGGRPVAHRALTSIRLHHHVFVGDSHAGAGAPAAGYVPAAYPLAKCYTF